LLRNELSLLQASRFFNDANLFLGHAVEPTDQLVDLAIRRVDLPLNLLATPRLPWSVPAPVNRTWFRMTSELTVDMMVAPADENRPRAVWSTPASALYPWLFFYRFCRQGPLCSIVTSGVRSASVVNVVNQRDPVPQRPDEPILAPGITAHQRPEEIVCRLECIRFVGLHRCHLDRCGRFDAPLSLEIRSRVL